jgi:hypothetical protein
MQFSNPYILEGKPVIMVTVAGDHDYAYLKTVLEDHGSPLAQDYAGEAIIFDMTNLFSGLTPIRLVDGTSVKAEKGETPPPPPPNVPPIHENTD